MAVIGPSASTRVVSRSAAEFTLFIWRSCTIRWSGAARSGCQRFASLRRASWMSRRFAGGSSSRSSTAWSIVMPPTAMASTLAPAVPPPAPTAGFRRARRERARARLRLLPQRLPPARPDVARHRAGADLVAGGRYVHVVGAEPARVPARKHGPVEQHQVAALAGLLGE